MQVYILLLVLASCLLGSADHDGCESKQASPVGQAQVVYEWVSVEYEWPTEAMRAQYVADGRFVVSHNYLSAVKTHRDKVYVTVPRLGYTTGVPSTLNVLVTSGNKTLLRPFPSWEAQELGNCNAIQCAMSIEIDPITEFIYVIDPGRPVILGNTTKIPGVTYCPAKLVVYNLRDGSLVRRHFFPEDLVIKETNFLNDIVIDRGSRYSLSARHVYITDAIDSKLIAFDLTSNRTSIFQHPSMDAELGDGADITVNGVKYTMRIPIDGLAISKDFHYVYYCALGSKKLYQVPSRALRDSRLSFASHVRYVGSKVSQTGGMTYGTHNLYFGALGENAVYRWDFDYDKARQNAHDDEVEMKTQTLIAKDDARMQWPDSFTIDDHGYLWFSACKAQLFLRGGMDYTGNSGPNYRIWKVKISEESYLYSPYAAAVVIGK
ncbi:uncharacterized protein LOC131951790 [Physella acuta]|uniref:uncharacterized protein LOC131951790 n=1 Tax=Physella acuta TaxID=109671 RepID=UPI0027DD1A47|nr:uncharacterized protein LOC131951790 [Physella acuta]